MPDEERGSFRALDWALVLAENIRLLIAVPIAAGLTALAVSFLLTPIYTATTRILPPAQQQIASGILAAQLGTLAVLGGAAGLRNPTDQHVALLRSRSVADAMVQRFGLKDLYAADHLEDARRGLERRTKVLAGVKDGIISIEVDDPDPKRAADMANAYVDELRNLSKTLAITEAAQRRLFFETQLLQAKDSLTRSEVALRRSGVSEATLKVLPQSALEALARLKAQIAAQEIKLASMRTFMTDANPEFRLAFQELTALRAELSKLEQSSVSKAQGNGEEYIAKFRDFKYHETLFELIGKQYELARIDEAREGAVIQVVDAATPPERKSRPKKGLIAVSTTIAFFLLTILFVFMRNEFRKAAHHPQSADRITRIRRLLRFT